jgi:molybdenum cofactor biosynthesis enzyme MoaA
MTRFIASDKLKFHPKNVSEFLESGFSTPISAQFQITNRCRYRCLYCYKILNEKESEVTDRFIERLKSLGVKSIVLTGGEPVIYKKFSEDIPRLAEHFQLGIVTTLCKYQPLLETDFEWVKVSMDTVDEVKFKEIKRGEGLKDILINLEKLYSRKRATTPLGTQIVLTDMNNTKSDLIKFIERVSDICDYIQIRPIESVDPYIYKQSDYDFINHLKDTYSKITISEKFKLNQKPKACLARWSKLLINVDHDIMLCCNQSQERIGSIYEHDILEKSKKIHIDFKKCHHSCIMSANNYYLEGIINGRHKDFV